MNYGKMIYYHRKHKGWSQAQLCQDICSVTHLSKIENGSKEVHFDLIEELLHKLNVSIEMEEEKLEEIKLIIDDIADSIQRKNYTLGRQLLRSIEKYSAYLKYTEYVFLYELTKAWFYIQTENFKMADKLLEKLGKFKKKFSQYEMCLYYFIIALYRFHQNSIYEAWDYLEKISECKESQIFNEKLTEYYFYRALISAQLKRNGLSIHYSYKALSVFEIQHNFKRILDTEILLAIELIKTGDLKRSESLLHSVYKNATLFKDKITQKSALHNLGYLYFQKNEFVMANEFYFKALKLVEKNSSSYFSLITNIVQNLIFLGKLVEAKELSGSILTEMTNKENSEYIRINCLYLESSGDENEYMNYLDKVVIPRMILDNNFKKIIEYKEILAKYLIKHGNFEEAAMHLLDCNLLMKQ